jgi:hypothetical protein
VVRAVAHDRRIYCVDVAKRMGTYRVEEELLAAAAAAAAERGDTVTDVLKRALRAYIRAGETAALPPAAEVSVYTPSEPSPSPGCRHPSLAVDEFGMCHECDTEVW